MNARIYTILSLVTVISLNARADDFNTITNICKPAIIQNSGAAAGETASGYAEGNSVVLGVSAAALLAGVILATQHSGGSNTSTTTTTSTTSGK